MVSKEIVLLFVTILSFKLVFGTVVSLSVASTILSHSRSRQNDPDGPLSSTFLQSIISASPQLDHFLMAKNEIPSNIQHSTSDWPGQTTARSLPHFPPLNELQSVLPDHVPNLDLAHPPQLPDLDVKPPSFADLESAMHGALVNIMPTMEMDGSCYKLCF